jgi:hypothetical protein
MSLNDLKIKRVKNACLMIKCNNEFKLVTGIKKKRMECLKRKILEITIKENTKL